MGSAAALNTPVTALPAIFYTAFSDFMSGSAMTGPHVRAYSQQLELLWLRRAAGRRSKCSQRNFRQR